MNDDFLRRMRRPPSAAFERQLRARLREQELNETSRRRPRWRVLTIAMLVAGSALATATYLTLSRAPSQSATPAQTNTDSTSPQRQSARDGAEPERNQWVYGVNRRTAARDPSVSSARQEQSIGAARDNNQTSTASSSDKHVATTQNVSSAGSPTSTTTRPIRIVASPDIAPLLKDTSSDGRYTRSASFEVDSAGAALPTLCAAEEADQPDMVITSRRARKEEFKLCKRPHYNGEVLEGTLGHVAIVVTRAKSGAPMQLSTETLRLALLKRVPAPDNSSQLIDNPYTHWNQIDPALEDRRIEVLGPARDTPEFLVFASIVLAPACENNASLDEDLCHSVRDDGIYTAARFDANFVPQRLWSDPNVVAIMDYRFYAANSADLLGSLLPGAAPTRESIIDGKYIGARTLHAYVNSGRYRDVPKVRSLTNDYLRLPANLHTGAIIPADVNLDWKRPYDAGPKLTEVKLD